MTNTLSKKDVIVLTPQSTLTEALNLFAHFTISHCPVVKDEKLVGIITKTQITDLLNKALLANDKTPLNIYFNQTAVGAIMHQEVMQLPANTEMAKILEAMDGNDVGSVVLTENNKIKGIVTETDIVRFMRRELADEISHKDQDSAFLTRLSLWLYDHGVVSVSKALGDIGI